jgi:hypothetical protein
MWVLPLIYANGTQIPLKTVNHVGPIPLLPVYFDRWKIVTVTIKQTSKRPIKRNGPIQ